ARTGPSRRSPANSPKNAPAVSADEPRVEPHCSQPAGHCQTPATTDTTARAAPDDTATHIAPVMESDRLSTRSAAIRYNANVTAEPNANTIPAVEMSMPPEPTTTIAA